MAHFQQVSILKTCIILFSPLLQSPEYETSKALEEFSEKELTKPKLFYTISLMTAQLNQGKITH
jgi:hypothetical protein